MKKLLLSLKMCIKAEKNIYMEYSINSFTCIKLHCIQFNFVVRSIKRVQFKQQRSTFRQNTH